MRTLFGDFTTGTIDRGGFILWTVLIFVIALVFVIALGGFAALYDTATGTQGGTPALNGVGALAVLVFMLALGVAQINLVAKRTRDIGWSVPLVVILYIIGVPLVWLVLAIVKGRGAAL